MSTELNALAAGARTNAGTELANHTNLDKYGKLEVQVAFGSAPAAGGFLTVYMIGAPDGTNYMDGSSSVDPGANKIVCILPVRAATGAQRISSTLIELEPAKTKFLLNNNTSQAFPATGSVLKIFTANDETA